MVMSDERKELHVKDLVVRADNVMFERPNRNRDRDFLFGPRRRREEEMEMNEDHVMEEESTMEEAEEDHHEEDHDDDHRDRRPPFSGCRFFELVWLHTSSFTYF